MNTPQLSSLPFLAAICSLLLLASVALSGTSRRVGVPVILPFLGLGLLASSTSLGVVLRQSYHVSFVLGTLSLVLILFDGGLNTPLSMARSFALPSIVLATVGVLGTTALFALCARLFGFSWPQAFLLGAVVSPTDAAVVFPVLRGSGIQPQKRVASILELESCLNDPVAASLTPAFTLSLAGEAPLAAQSFAHMALSLGVGGVFGLGLGWLGRVMAPRIRPAAGGLYPLMTLGFALLAFGLPELVGGSGFLAVYLAGLIMGNSEMPYRAGILRVHDSLAWLGQVVMYLVLGLLITPSHLLKVAPQGIALGILLSAFARPGSVMLCLLPFRYPLRELVYLAVVGLRGALPIILATYPLLWHVEDARLIFDTVFFVVLVNTFVPGSMVLWLTRQLGIESDEPPPPPALLEVVSTRVLTGAKIISFSLEASAAACGAPISELPFPPDSAVILLIRDNEVIAPKGATVLAPGDHVYVLCKPADQPFIQLLLGRPEA